MEVRLLLNGSWSLGQKASGNALADDVNEISRLEMHGYMTDLLLRDTDFMSMASSLEVRVPFVDKVVVRHVLQMPGRWKLARRPKSLLLESMRGAIPRYVWDRRKMGFVFPFERWMKSTLRSQITETLNEERLARATGLSPYLGHVWARFARGECRWSKPWSLFVLMRWCDQHRVAL
jgi:asparagine synthase (glutamine-hydrolysing)